MRNEINITRDDFGIKVDEFTDEFMSKNGLTVEQVYYNESFGNLNKSILRGFGQNILEVFYNIFGKEDKENKEVVLTVKQFEEEYRKVQNKNFQWANSFYGEMQFHPFYFGKFETYPALGTDIVNEFESMLFGEEED